MALCSYGGVTLRIVQNGGQIPQFTPGEPRWAEQPIPGTNLVNKQYMGRGDERLRVEAIVQASGAVDSLKALVGPTTRTLTDYPAKAGQASYTGVFLLAVTEPAWYVGLATETTTVVLEFAREVA